MTAHDWLLLAACYRLDELANVYRREAARLGALDAGDEWYGLLAHYARPTTAESVPTEVA